MLKTLFIQLHVTLVALLAPLRPRRLARPRRGAEFIEVALYAAIIVAIAWVLRAGLSGAFDNVLQRITDALNG